MSEFKEEASENVEREQIMTIVDEVPSESFERLLETESIKGESQESRQHVIKDFLTRPIQLDTITITEDMPQNTIIAKHGFPSSLLKMQMYAEKLSGFKYLRGSIKVMLRSNSQIMQCCAVQAMMMPVDSPNELYNTQVSTSMMNASQVPGGILLMAKGNVFEYEQPFVYPTTAYDMTIKQPDYVSMIVKILSPLRGNGTPITLTIFVRFADNVEVSMPTSDPLFYAPQVLFDQLRKMIRMDIESARKIEGLSQMYKTMRDIKNQGVAEEQKNVSSGGPVSSVLSTVGSLGGMLAGSGIPVLSEIGAVGSVVASVAGGIASMFGFSSPDNNAVQTLTFPSIFKGANNSNYPHTHHQMALDVQNKLAVDRQVYATPVDELALHTIARTPTLIKTYTLNNTKVPSSLLFTLPVTPMRFEFGGFEVGDHIDISSAALASCCFEYWRGGNNYVLVPVKTIFHSARIMVVWFNSDEDVPSTYSPELGKNYSVLIDLSEERMEYGFNIPYVQALQWLSTSNLQFKAFNGQIAFYLINKLVNASNSSADIDLLLYHYVSSDFELAIPRSPAIYFQNTQYTILPSTVQSSAWSYVAPATPVEGSNLFAVTSPTGVESTQMFMLDLCGFGSCPNETKYHVQENQYQTLGSWKKFNWIIFHLQANPTQVTMKCGMDDETPTTRYVGPIWYFKNKIVVDVRLEVLQHAGIELQINRTECVAGKECDSIANNEQVTTPAANLTIGESIRSVRCLIKRAHPTVEYKESTIGGKTWIVINALVPVSTTALPTVPYKDFFAPAYRFQSGGMRYYLTIKNPVSPNIPVYFVPNMQKLTVDPSTLNTSQIMFCPVIEGVCKLEVPYYNRNILSIIGDLETHTDLQQTFHLLVFEKPEADWTLQISAGEDFSMGYYIGAPRMRITGVFSNAINE